jgi:two-component system, cell cycle sensor histidine kinase and response regulator CckA
VQLFWRKTIAGGIAHDFNNLLMVMMGNISLVKTSASDEQVEELLTEAEHACRRATSLTRPLLTFSKGGAPVRRTVFISELLQESTVFALRGSNVSADLTITGALWPVDADVGQLHQVIHNMVLNAAQAMPEGGIVRVQAENIVLGAGDVPALQPGRYVTIAVVDHGYGIPSDAFPNLFDPYFTTKVGGSGLGLATAFSIITKHEGYITVASEVGVGTTFCIYIPASEHVVESTQERTATALIASGRILVMDDEEAICNLLRAMLTRLGYIVDCVRNGTEAIDAYERARAAGQPFAAVILDLTIPGGMGGLAAIERLRAIDPQVKALVSSGYANDPVMADFQHYGFSGVIEKPYSTQSLQEALQRVLRDVHP